MIKKLSVIWAVSSGSTPLLMFTNTAAKPTFLLVLFYPSYYCFFLHVVRSVAFSYCHSTCLFLLHRRTILFANHGGCCVWFISSILPYIFVPIFLGTLLYVLLTFHFLCSFGSLCRPVYLVSLCIRCCFTVYTEILVPVRSFLFSGESCLLLNAGLLLVKSWKLMYILCFLCACCLVYVIFLQKLCYIVGRHSLCLIYCSEKFF